MCAGIEMKRRPYFCVPDAEQVRKFFTQGEQRTKTEAVPAKSATLPLFWIYILNIRC